MDVKHLRRQCEARLKDLDLPVPFDVWAFCDTVANLRARPVVLVPTKTARGQYGLWAAMSATDIIFYERETSPWHQEHIILHELCHMLCGHEAGHISESSSVLELVPDAQAAATEHMLKRAGYSTEEEREAEMLASLILERAAHTTVTSPESAQPVLARLGAVLEEGAQPKE